MKAVIMCGGLGSRLRPLTENKPKPLLRLLNVPVLQLIVQKVKNAGINDILLSLGYKAQDIIEYCERNIKDVSLSYFEEEKPLGTAGGVKNCISHTDEDILVLSGDNVFNIDLKDLIRFHRQNQADVTIAGKEVTDPREYGTILCGDNGKINGFIEKPTWETAESCLINTGIYVLKGNVLDMIPENSAYDFSDQLFPEIMKKNMLFLCYKTDAFWGDIGEIPAYLELSAEMVNTFTDEFVYSGTLYREDGEDNKGNRFMAPCMIGDHCRIGSNNVIGPDCVIGHNVVIGDGCTLRGSVIGTDVEISSGTDILDAIVDDCAVICENCVVEKDAVIGYGVKIGRFSRILPACRIWPGRCITPEAVISGDMFYETPERIEADLYGVSGKLYTQFSLSDAVRLGQAIASVKAVGKIGVGTDGREESDLYKAVFVSGIKACGAASSDFGRIYKAQAYFFSAYFQLDAFIFISTLDKTVQFSFFGKYGFPVPAKTARGINNYFRFSTFVYSPETLQNTVFHKHLMKASYMNALFLLMPENLAGRKLHVECENTMIRDMLALLFRKYGAQDDVGGIQFLINETGTEMYCVEGERFYSADRIKAVLCELAFAREEKVLLPEDAPDLLTEKAEAYNCPVVRIGACKTDDRSAAALMIDNLWNFDAVFLCAKLIGVLSEADTDLDHLMSLQQEFVIRKKVIEMDCDASGVRTLIRKSGAMKDTANDGYYRIDYAKGSAKIRQLGNTNRIKLLVQAADTEAAKELSAEVLSKIKGIIIDKKDES